MPRRLCCMEQRTKLTNVGAPTVLSVMAKSILFHVYPGQWRNNFFFIVNGDKTLFLSLSLPGVDIHVDACVNGSGYVHGCY